MYTLWQPIQHARPLEEHVTHERHWCAHVHESCCPTPPTWVCIYSRRWKNMLRVSIIDVHMYINISAAPHCNPTSHARRMHLWRALEEHVTYELHWSCTNAAPPHNDNNQRSHPLEAHEWTCDLRVLWALLTCTCTWMVLPHPTSPSAYAVFRGGTRFLCKKSRTLVGPQHPCHLKQESIIYSF